MELRRERIAKIRDREIYKSPSETVRPKLENYLIFNQMARL
jgi:hypothetical protein